MEKVTISITYDVKFWVSANHCLTTCGKVINVQKGVELKQFLRGKYKAVYIDGIACFINELKPIEKIRCPF